MTEFNRAENPAEGIVLRLEDRNRVARSVIDHYVGLHQGTDVAIGLIGLIPGAAVPALMASIALQAPVVYQPMARKLGAVYLAKPDEISDAQDNIVAPSLVPNAALDILADFFGKDFMMQIATELLAELGFGSLLSLIPFVGAVFAAYLDYEIATKMTNRVGKMVAIYFQNGAHWVVSKEHTYKISKEMPADLNQLRERIPAVRETLSRSVSIYVRMMRFGMDTAQIRQVLRTERIPEDLIETVLRAA